ncbi:MAG: hypothetical protein QNJ05_04430 [Woeseiaceae bacterium]|nr:hypothetical protein [Woeseiaceae bacterium]
MPDLIQFVIELCRGAGGFPESASSPKTAISIDSWPRYLQTLDKFNRIKYSRREGKVLGIQPRYHGATGIAFRKKKTATGELQHSPFNEEDNQERSHAFGQASATAH